MGRQVINRVLGEETFLRLIVGFSHNLAVLES